MPWSRPRPLRYWLLLVALAAGLPLILYAGVILWRVYDQDQFHYRQRLQQTAADLAHDIDRELDSLSTFAATLASSQSIRSREFAQFHEWTRSLLSSQGIALLLVEPDGQMLLNTRVAYGTPLPVSADKETLQKVVATRKPVISNMFIGKVSKQWVLDVAVPVIENGQVRYILLLSFFPETIRDVSLGQQLPADWITGVSDLNGRVIARSEAHEKLVGTMLPKDLIENRHSPSVGEVSSLDGTPVLRAVWPLERAKWFVAATVDRALVTTSARRALSDLFLWGALILLLGSWLATWLVRMLSGSIRDLAKAGESLLDESKFCPVASPISEINIVQRYLSRVIERRRGQQAELARLASITLAAHDALIGVDRSGRIEVWNAGAERLFGYAHSEAIGQPVEMLVPEPVRTRHASGLSSVLQGQPVEPYDTERLHKNGQVIPVSISMRPVMSRECQIVGIAKAVYDLTDRKRSEARQQLLLRELAHRVKNVFAVLQSVLRLSVRATFNTATFAEDFAGRIQSMGIAHDILTAGDWQSVELDGLVSSQLRPYLTDRRPRVVVSGEKVMLPPDLAVPLGLALHELATNAAKYGALSVASGRVRLSWTVRRVGSECELTLIWQENGGPPATPPTRTGFGSTLIENGIPGATVERSFEPAGVVCTMVLHFAEPK